MVETILSCASSETLFFWKKVSNEILHKKQKTLECVKYGPDEVIDEDINEAYYSVCTVDISEVRNKSKTVDEWWEYFIQDLWQSSYNNRLHGVYYMSMKDYKEVFGRKWVRSMENDAEWTPEFERILEQRNSAFKYQLKIMLPMWLFRDGLACAYLLASQVFWWEYLQNIIENGDDITPYVMIQVFLCAASVFSSFFTHWMSPRLWIQDDHFTNICKLGKHSYIHGFNFIFTLRANGRFEDFTSYVRSIVEPNYFGIKSRIDKMCIAKAFNKPKFNKLVFGIDKNGHHWSHNFPHVTCVYFNKLCFSLSEVIDECWNTGSFNNGAGFDSDCMRGRTVLETTAYVWSNYTGFHCSESSKVKIHRAFNKICKNPLKLDDDFGRCIGITRIAKDYIDDS